MAREIHKAMDRNIPFKNARPADKSHPWIDAQCAELQEKAHLGDEDAEQALENRLAAQYDKYAERHHTKYDKY